MRINSQGALEWVILIGAAVLALGTIRAKVIKPAFREWAEFKKLLLTLIGIASTFEPNSGDSLYDQVVAIRTEALDARTQAASAISVAEATLAELRGRFSDIDIKLERIEQSNHSDDIEEGRR